MKQQTTRVAYRARWLYPVDSPPLPEGVITVEGSRIVAVGQNLSHRPPRDLGNVGLLPGLINAHTHLEFSNLAEPLGSRRLPLAEWIPRVVARRQEEARRSGDPAAERTTAVVQGLAESLAAGVTRLAEIATTPWDVTPFESSPCQAIVFQELLGLDPQRSTELLERASRHVEGASATSHWWPGLSPHAPYTVRPELVLQTCRLASARRVPVAMHLAESPEELELLASSSGPLVECLSELDAWDPSAIPRGIRPLDYLDMLRQADRALVVHGNFLDDEELAFLAAHASQLSVVYCPRTYDFFHAGCYPLSQMLDRGVRVALGTDSRASNPDLHLLEEMRFVSRRHPQLPAAGILKMGTLYGAQALGWEARIGSLRPGKRADLIAVGLPDRSEPDPHALLWDSSLPVCRVICGGRQMLPQANESPEP